MIEVDRIVPIKGRSMSYASLPELGMKTTTFFWLEPLRCGCANDKTGH